MAGASSTSHTNRLIHETSPYLLQHAHNPVDWYPWGEEAFRKARDEQKPIFLSIGYSTCHWCHVMERESFENEAIAALLNQYFVCIKVDREERPDIDQIYMTAVQATTGSGGWPMSVWLTPERQPFYCGTYFPPESRWGRPGFKELIQRVHDVWEANQAGVIAQAKELTAALEQQTTISSDGSEKRPLDDKALAAGYELFSRSFDEVHGGFGGAPKFPRPVVFNFLFRYQARSGAARARDMALQTLRAMGEGGLFDQLGGGFHRYSVDERWLVSHFEKMLYDQAQLVVSYGEAYQLTHDPFFAEIAVRTGDYVLREMTSPVGGFYSAEDADSAGEEGTFYVWTREEIDRLVADEPAREIFCRYYGVERDGNWEQGRNVLHVTMSLAQAAKLFHQSETEIAGTLAVVRAKLLAAREQRVRPHRDDKILTAWNGLMISALCKAAQLDADVGHASRVSTESGRSLDTRDAYPTAQKSGRDARSTTGSAYLTAAQRAARYLLQQHVRDGRLLRTPTVPAVLDDYAFFANALVDLYETDFDARWLEEATRLTDMMLTRFYDQEHGGFFLTAGEDPSVILRIKEAYDGAEPSGNSVATMLLLRLAQFTDRDQYRQAAEKTLRLFADHLQRAGHALPQMLCVLDFSLGKPRQVVIAGDREAADTRSLIQIFQERYLPNSVVMLADAGLARWLPFVTSCQPLAGKATAYVCVNYACQLPTADRQKFIELLEQK